MTIKQAMIWTVLPVDIVTKSGGSFLDFSVIVSPRLQSTSSADLLLQDFPDWSPGGTTGGARTWPDTLAKLAGSLTLELLDVPITAGAPGPRRFHATVVNDPQPGVLFGSQPPSAELWSAMFGPHTKVTPYVFKGMDKRRIRSAPVGTVNDAINTMYGHHGLTSPAVFPTYGSLIASSSVGPLGFNEPAGLPDFAGAPRIAGYTRRTKLLDALQAALVKHRAVPTDLASIPVPGVSESAAVTARTLAFLQAQQFLQRPQRKPEPVVNTNPAWDFHQIIGAAASLPSLLRALGLILDLRVGPIPQSTLDAWQARQHTHTVAVRLAFNTADLLWPKASTSASASNANRTQTVTPPTAALVTKAYFRAKPLNPAKTDLESGMLKVGDRSLFRLIRLDHDDAALKVMQLADNVTRSRTAQGKLTLTTPDNFALPALRTGGFAIAETGRAVAMATTLQRQTDTLQDGYFGSPPKEPPLHAEDITRGYRFDVFNKEQTDSWLSLMWRQGTISVAGADPLVVVEEDTIVPAPTTAGIDNPVDPSDLYLQETLTKWDGWSLGVPRIGLPFYGGPPQSQPDVKQGSTGFNVTTSWSVPGSTTTTNQIQTSFGKLPPLRFGQTYQMRARAVDLAGNSLSPSQAPGATSGDLVTRPLQHLRFEPAPAPRMLLLARPDPGASEEVMVVRSESGANQASGGIDTASAVRMVVPGPSSIVMAEQHGKFDIPDPNVTGEQEMDASVTRYNQLAKADATRLSDLGQKADPTLVHSATNPYLFPSFLPIGYLPEVLGQTALVRGLPANASKATTARLPFDPLTKGWPSLQAARIGLVKGATNNWATGVVTNPSDSTQAVSELALSLEVGDMVACLLNCQITKDDLAKMALWEQIRIQAAAAKWNAKRLAELEDFIVAGGHWMFTPWREILFVHAVRTPLKVPVLFLRPTKSTIGQTYAEFDGLKTSTSGTVEMSRKSTAKIDVNGTWSMPIDDGTSPLTVDTSTLSGIKVTPYAGHAFTLEVPRIGEGIVPGVATTVQRSVDALNFDARHEFNDTRFRAVNYQATATSYYIEYFRQQLTLSAAPDPVADLRSMGQVKPGVAFEASTVKLLLVGTDNSDPTNPLVQTHPLVQAPVGTDPSTPAPTPGDYVVVEDPTLNTSPATATHGYIQMLTHSSAASTLVAGTRTVVFSYVGPTIHTFSNPAADKTTFATMHVPSSKRPSAPSPLYVIPITSRADLETRTGSSVTWTRNALRVYLNRPWWSSGDGERLGVVCWHQGNSSAAVPPTDLAPFVTQWGFDPIHKSRLTLASGTKQPTPACFPLATATASDASLSIEEISTKVDVAGHSVQYDKDRDLWFADIKVTSPRGAELESYTPFIRFALVRYQPNSITGAALSKVVTVDYAQVAPNRHLSVTGNETAGYTVTVAGYAPTHDVSGKSTGASRVRVTLETEDTRITDASLAWRPAMTSDGPVSIRLASSVADTDKLTYTGTIHVVPTSGPGRLTIEEFELFTKDGQTVERLVFSDSIPVATPRT